MTKLKHFWIQTGGSDYFESLVSLRKETPVTHKSSDALNKEMEAIAKVHRKFVLWTGTKAAKAKLNKTNE